MPPHDFKKSQNRYPEPFSESFPFKVTFNSFYISNNYTRLSIMMLSESDLIAVVSPFLK